MSKSPKLVKTIIFDAVGTLMEPSPPVWEVYGEIASRHGGQVPSRDELLRRFVTSFRVQEEIDRENCWRTNESREQERWQVIVRECLPDIDDPEACFADLFAHFAKPEAWAIPDGVGDALSELQRRGHTIGIGSNFDSRLRGVTAGLPELAPVTEMFISSEIGWRKPSEHFFAAMSRQFEEILFVGDDLANDYHGAINAGIGAVLLDPKGAFLDVSERIASIREIVSAT